MSKRVYSNYIKNLANSVEGNEDFQIEKSLDGLMENVSKLSDTLALEHKTTDEVFQDKDFLTKPVPRNEREQIKEKVQETIGGSDINISEIDTDSIMSRLGSLVEEGKKINIHNKNDGILPNKPLEDLQDDDWGEDEWEEEEEIQEEEEEWADDDWEEESEVSEDEYEWVEDEWEEEEEILEDEEDEWAEDDWEDEDNESIVESEDEWAEDNWEEDTDDSTDYNTEPVSIPDDMLQETLFSTDNTTQSPFEIGGSPFDTGLQSTDSNITSTQDVFSNMGGLNTSFEPKPTKEELENKRKLEKYQKMSDLINRVGSKTIESPKVIGGILSLKSKNKGKSIEDN